MWLMYRFSRSVAPRFLILPTGYIVVMIQRYLTGIAGAAWQSGCRKQEILGFFIFRFLYLWVLRQKPLQSTSICPNNFSSRRRSRKSWSSKALLELGAFVTSGAASRAFRDIPWPPCLQHFRRVRRSKGNHPEREFLSKGTRGLSPPAVNRLRNLRLL